MGMLEEIALHLTASSTSFVAGQTMFTNVLPKVDVAAVTMFETGGTEPSEVYGSSMAAWENASVQIIARTTRPSSGSLVPYTSNARAMIHKVWVTLPKVVNQTLSGSTAYYLRITAKQSPMLIPGQEDDGRISFSVNFDVMRKPSVTY